VVLSVISALLCLAVSRSWDGFKKSNL